MLKRNGLITSILFIFMNTAEASVLLDDLSLEIQSQVRTEGHLIEETFCHDCLRCFPSQIVHNGKTYLTDAHACEGFDPSMFEEFFKPKAVTFTPIEKESVEQPIFTLTGLSPVKDMLEGYIEQKENSKLFQVISGQALTSQALGMSPGRLKTLKHSGSGSDLLLLAEVLQKVGNTRRGKSERSSLKRSLGSAQPLSELLIQHTLNAASPPR